ncbi:MAG: NAD(P)H-binding protein [Arenibacterium sp.]
MSGDPRQKDPGAQRVFLLGASGTIGRATVRALREAGHEVVCFLRNLPDARSFPRDVEVRVGDVTRRDSLARDGFRGERFDALVSCLASRTGTPKDAWAIDHDAHLVAFDEAKKAHVQHVVLLSAICVQRPKLAFQEAKLAAERALIESGTTYSIVRPTAFFKSLSGQIERVKRGKPFLLFGNGKLTKCKPVSDRDLGQYLADCLHDAERLNRILPIGGPGPAITPLEQGQKLFELTGQTPKFRHVPIGLMDGIIAILGLLGRVSTRMRDKVELARIGRYYATESMLFYDVEHDRYDAAATPSTGQDTLFRYYEDVLAGRETVSLGDHAVFEKGERLNLRQRRLDL